MRMVVVYIQQFLQNRRLVPLTKINLGVSPVCDQLTLVCVRGEWVGGGINKQMCRETLRHGLDSRAFAVQLGDKNARRI